MNSISAPNTTLFFSSIDAISDEIWSELDCEKNVYFNRYFLKAIEKNHPEITFYYIVLKDSYNKSVAFTSIQIIDFYLDTVNNSFELFATKIKSLLRKLRVFPNKKPLQLLISGNTFVSGEHGVFLKHQNNKKQRIKELSKAILELVNTKQPKKIDAFLLKDFINDSLHITDALKEFNYHPFSVEPNMVLKLKKNWSTFDDYLAALKTKFRVKARRAFELSKDLKIEEVTLENIHELLPKMTHLYEKVTSKAAFNLSNFNLSTYTDLKLHFGDSYILKTYSIEGKVVGFLSGIINQNCLDAHFVGIDYNLNKTHAIYQRMLYNYIEIAISRNIATLNFGRTASEIKSSVGAEPQDLTMYLRHKKGLTNKILKLFLQRVAPSPFHQKYPIKKTDS